MSLEWREQLSVGNDLIDSDHKYLIGLINRIEESMATMNRGQLTEGLDSLSRYSLTHFALEEKIADGVHYPQIPRLHESHEALLGKLEQVRQELDEDWTPTSIEHFIALLRAWLINHVIKEDLLMKPFLSKRSPSFDPR
jgi:hemerythrin